MDSKEYRFFVLDLLNFVFQIVGKPLPCHLQRKLDNYARQDDTNVTLNIKKAIMININYYLVSIDVLGEVAFAIYETKKKELVKKYTPSDFLKLLSHFAYASVLEFAQHQLDSPELFFTATSQLLEKLRTKEKINADLWKILNQSAISLIEEDRGKNNYLPLRKSTADLCMFEEKGFVLKIMNYVFDLYCRNLPDYLESALNEYRTESLDNPNFKNATFVLMNEMGRKIKLLNGIEPIVLYYYNLCRKHFNQKYFLEFCICCTRKALMEYCNESKDVSPKNAYELLVYFILLAKEDGKFSSLEEMNEAASLLLEEDRDRIEHERLRHDISVENSTEVQPAVSDSESLIANCRVGDCKCCTLF